MGYTLTIGEAALDFVPEYAYVTIKAEPASDDVAPDHCPRARQTNSRSPSYAGWENFCTIAGPEVYELFFGGGDTAEDNPRDAPLLASHPGYAVLTRYDLKVFREARIRRENTNGGRKPGFDWGLDDTLARLLWLEFWTEWALENCKVPILENM